MNKKSNNVIAAILVAIVAIDQFSKYLAPFFDFSIVLNKGVSLSFLSFLPASLMTIFIIFLTIFISLLFRGEWMRYPVASGLFFGGAISNILDRVFYGAVRDWLKVPFFKIHNNLADWFIFLGLGLFLLYTIRNEN